MRTRWQDDGYDVDAGTSDQRAEHDQVHRGEPVCLCVRSRPLSLGWTHVLMTVGATRRSMPQPFHGRPGQVYRQPALKQRTRTGCFCDYSAMDAVSSADMPAVCMGAQCLQPPDLVLHHALVRERLELRECRHRRQRVSGQQLPVCSLRKPAAGGRGTWWRPDHSLASLTGVIYNR